ncbi:MAG: hypothetical protein M1815_000674 [Lichina confinis]|nr:MAG: hypothetical protein M1815_000674 [Lichina confinis]
MAPWADEQEVPGLDEASEAVDALVGDRAIVPGESEVTEAQVEQPAEIQQASTAAPETLQSEEPPAAQSHTAVAAVVARDAPAPSEVSSGLRVITPALPIIPIKQTATAPIQEQPPEPPAEGPNAIPHTIKEKPESDSRAGASVTVEKPATQSQSVPGAEKQGSLRSTSEAQEKAEEKVEDKAQATAPAEVWTKVGSGGAKKTAKEAVKRSPPGKLDIMAATRELIRETQALSAPGAAKPSSQKKSNTSAGSTPPSAPNARLPPAKTLRVVATPKLSTPQDETRGLTISTGDTASSAAAAQTHKSSAASTQVPATPVTDNPSELGSGTPGLLSRANSPAPARGGTGGTEATRESSKASKKKQRQEAKKQMKAKEQEKKTAEKKEDAARKEPEELLVSKMTDEEVAPIIGRKKKKPKPRSSPRKVPTTPIISRPSSTVPSEMEPAKEDSGETEPSGAVDVKEPAEQAKQVEKNVRTSDDGKKDSEIEARTPKPEEDVAKETGAGSGPKAGSDAPPSDEFPHLTPARIMSSLIAEGELDPAKLAFFNPALGVGKTLESSLADLDAHIRKSITLPKHRAHLESSGFGTGGGGGGGAVRTRESLRERVPQSASIVRGLDPDQDARLAELEQRVFDMGEAEQRAFLAILNQTMASSSAADGADTSDGWSTMAAAALSGEPPSITVNLPPLSTSLLSASSSAMSFATNTKDQQAGSSLGSGSGIGFGTSLTSGPGLRTTVNNPYRTTPMPSTTILTIPFRSHNSDIIPNSTVSTANTANTANTSISNTGNNNSNSNNNSSNFTGELEDLARKVKEAEAQLEKHAKEGEELEKRLMALIMHNRRLVGLS